MIVNRAYLKKLGYTREQAHLLLSAAPIDSHVAALVDTPKYVTRTSMWVLLINP